MRRSFTIFLAALGMALLSFHLAYAGKEEMKDQFLQQMRNYERDMRKAESVLKDKANVDWSQKEQEDYLLNAMYSVYYATNAFVTLNQRHPTSVDELASFAGMTNWPGNPYKNWDSIKLVNNSGEFLPGDLIIQLCPPDAYSVPENPRPMTYVISINGPTRDFSPSDTDQLKPFFDWALIPEGTAFISAASWTSAKQKLEQREKARKAKEESEKLKPGTP